MGVGPQSSAPCCPGRLCCWCPGHGYEAARVPLHGCVCCFLAISVFSQGSDQSCLIFASVQFCYCESLSISAGLCSALFGHRIRTLNKCALNEKYEVIDYEILLCDAMMERDGIWEGFYHINSQAQVSWCQALGGK